VGGQKKLVARYKKEKKRGKEEARWCPGDRKLRIKVLAEARPLGIKTKKGPVKVALDIP